MIIFLCGSDDYRREMAKRDWISRFEKKYSALSVERFDLAEAGALENFRVFARGQSIFEKSKLAIVENLAAADEKIAAKEFGEFADDKSTTILFSEDKKPAKALKFLAEAEAPSKFEIFEYPQGEEMPSFIKKEASRLGVNLKNDAVYFLAEIYANDTWGLVTELEKLAHLGIAAGRKELEAIGLEAVPNYWATINGIKSQDIKNRTRALEKLFARNEPYAKVFNIISSLWKEKIPQAAEYDFKVKSGKLEYDEALLDLIL